MTLFEKLNSGTLHTQARAARPDCVDAKGNIHTTPERARFVDWLNAMKASYGEDVMAWPAIARFEYNAKYVPSH